MQPRPATHSDIPAMCALFLALKRKSDYVTIPHDLERAKATMRRCITSPQAYAGVVEDDGEVVAVLIGVTDTFWWGPRRYVSDIGFYSARWSAGRLLARHFIDWAWRQRGVVEVLMGESSGLGSRATRAFYEDLGFRSVGGMYRLSRYEAGAAMEGAA